MVIYMITQYWEFSILNTLSHSNTYYHPEIDIIPCTGHFQYCQAKFQFASLVTSWTEVALNLIITTPTQLTTHLGK